MVLRRHIVTRKDLVLAYGMHSNEFWFLTSTLNERGLMEVGSDGQPNYIMYALTGIDDSEDWAEESIGKYKWVVLPERLRGNPVWPCSILVSGGLS